jgi:hypothetical protein
VQPIVVVVLLLVLVLRFLGGGGGRGLPGVSKEGGRREGDEVSGKRFNEEVQRRGSCQR